MRWIYPLHKASRELRQKALQLMLAGEKDWGYIVEDDISVRVVASRCLTIMAWWVSWM